MKLSDLEKRVLHAFINNDVVRDRGWEDPMSAAWGTDFHLCCDMNGKTFSGVMSGMVLRGIIWTNGESFGLTDKGREVVKAHLEG